MPQATKLPPYSQALRRDYISINLERYERNQTSIRDIISEVAAHFNRKPVATSTVQRDLRWAREKALPNEMDPDALELLKPENFPRFRRLFKAPGGGYYRTNETHHALYWVMYALTRKVDLPDWVIEFWELPEDINEDIVEKEKLLTFILLMAPRHGKTMTVVHGLVALMCEFPDVRIIYCQGVQQTTQKIMSMVMLEMESNEKLKKMYGPFEDDNRMWSHRDGFILSKRTVHSITPTFMPAGINVNIRSLDADIIIIDDPQDLDRAESEATTAKDYRKITTEFMTRREPHTPVLMIGSHLPTLFGDVFTQLEDNLEDLQTEGQAILLRKRPAHNLDTCAGGAEHYDCLEWPEYRDWNFLMAQKALLGEELFEAVYQQEARIPGTRPFPPEIVKPAQGEKGILDYSRSWKTLLPSCPHDATSLYTTLGFDPAAGEGRKASYSALAVLQGCPECRRLYLVDYWEKRQSPDLHATTIYSFAKAFRPQYVRIEINAYQKALARDAQLTQYSQELRFHVDEWMTDDRKNTPEFGIPMLAKFMREGKFSVPYATLEDQNYARDLQSALIRYPNKPNDTAMAIWLAAGMLWQMFDMYGDTTPTYLPGYYDQPAYMMDEPLRVTLSDIREYSDSDSVGV